MTNPVNNTNSNLIGVNNINLSINANNVTNSNVNSEMYMWPPQPTTSFQFEETHLIENNASSRKKSTPLISTYTLAQIESQIQDSNPQTLSANNTSSNSSKSLNQEIQIIVDKDGKRFKCRKKILNIPLWFFCIGFFIKI